jgi:hypothetical protein
LIIFGFLPQNPVDDEEVAVPTSVHDLDVDGQYRRLVAFRQTLYGAFTGWADTLFEVVDALSCDPARLESLPYLSLRPQCRRGHGSLYKALDRGRIDPDALTATLAGAIDPAMGDVYAVDPSGWARPFARTSPQRTHNYDVTVAARTGGSRGARVTQPGWLFGWLAQVGPPGSSWTQPVHVHRIDPTHTPAQIALLQIRALLRHYTTRPDPTTPIVCLDAGFSVAAIAGPLAGEAVQLVIRLKTNLVFYTDPPPKTPGTPGRPRRHGPVFKLRDATTWPEPDQQLELPATGPHPTAIVTAWHHLHPAPSADIHEPGNDPTRNTNRELIHGTTIQIRSTDTRLPTLWLWWSGPADTFDLEQTARAYLRRFGIEHLFRFLKQYLAWTTPQFRHPDQAQRWSQLVAAAYTQLALARPLTTSHTPWHRHGPQTPHRVKQGFAKVHPHLGTPAKPPQPSKPGPGRPKGRPNQAKHPRQPPIKKGKG